MTDGFLGYVWLYLFFVLLHLDIMEGFLSFDAVLVQVLYMLHLYVHLLTSLVCHSTTSENGPENGLDFHSNPCRRTEINVSPDFTQASNRYEY